MIQILQPAVWLIALLAGLSLFPETIYSPSLPSIALALQTSESMVEYTLTIYLLAFGVGTLIWGRLSDRFGRKPCVLGGLMVFIVGCFGCYMSGSINDLLLARFVQAFGGSVGSVLGQAICRDSFHGPALGKTYAVVGSALAVFPAIGPILGGFISENFGWANIFLFLLFFGIVVSLVTAIFLPETHRKESRQPVSIKKVAGLLLHDKKVVGLGLIVAGSNGITFSYFAEGPFLMIQLLGLSPSQYGFSFIVLAISALCGSLLSKKLHDHHTSKTIMNYGINVVLAGCFCASVVAVLSSFILLPNLFLICALLLAQMALAFGSSMVAGNALALALVDYKWCIGTASSLFGFFYYSGISLITLGMGALHNGTLLPMPLYFLAISLLMIHLRKKL
jgi:DHA1 family bicyclomycin/chloramphenicol resistance-like MFS transporter